MRLRDKLTHLRAQPRLALVASAAVGFGARAVETGSKFLLQLIIARMLGPTGSGNIFLALSIANVGCTIGRIGLDRSLTFNIATAIAQGKGDQAALRPMLGTGMAICLLVSCLLAGGVAWAAGPMATSLFHDPAFGGPLRAMATTIVPLALLAMVVGILNAVERSGSAQMVGAALWPALAAVLALMMHDIDGMVAALIAAIMFATLAGLVLLWRRGLLPALTYSRDAARALTRFGWPLFVIDTVQITLISMPTIVLGMYRNAAEVGVFALANRISLILTVVLIVMAGLGSSRMAAAHARGDRAGLQQIMRSLFLIAFASSVPAVLVLAVFAPWVLGQFGAGFVVGAGVLRWLLLGQVVGIVFTCAPNVLEMTGNGWRLRRVNFLALAVNALLCFTLIPSFGSLGAALATSATLIVYNLICTFMVWRHVRIHASPLSLLGLWPRAAQQ